MGQRELGRLAGAAVIVTGGGHGIGRACAARLAEEGAHIAVADLDQSAAQQVATGLTPRDRPHMAVWLDVTDLSSVERAFADAVSGLGGIDVLINVAGGDTYHGTFEETTDEVWVSMTSSTFSVWSDAVGRRFLTCGAAPAVPRSSTSARSTPSPHWAANHTRLQKQESAPSPSTLRPVWRPMAFE